MLYCVVQDQCDAPGTSHVRWDFAPVYRIGSEVVCVDSVQAGRRQQVYLVECQQLPAPACEVHT